MSQGGQPWSPPNPDYPPPKAGEPPLHRAAREGDHAALVALAAAGADVNAFFEMQLDPDGRVCEASPLMVAAGSGDGSTANTIELLLRLGADPRAVSVSGSAADFACRGLGWNYRPGGDADRLGVLLRAGSPLTREGTAGARLLVECLNTGDLARFRLMLEAGVVVSPPAGPELSPYQIPLFAAAEAGGAEAVVRLLEAGADPLLRDRSQRTALFAVSSEAVARVLVAAGCGLEDRDQFGWTPLTLAAVEGDLGRAAALIAAGADVNATHDRGYTVFMSAVSSMDRSPEVIALLIASGADPRAVTHLGYTAFHAAIDVNGGEANEEASVRSTLARIKASGVDIEARNDAGQTPLVRALLHGTPIEVRVLCELGADPDGAGRVPGCGPDICDRQELPPLALAASRYNADLMTEALLAHGAQPRRPAPSGFTPLQLAVAGLLGRAPDDQRPPDDLWAALEATAARVKDQPGPVRASAFEEILAALVPAPESARYHRPRIRALALMLAQG
jgi:ankyrin repeat protein